MPAIADRSCCRRLGELLSPEWIKALADPTRTTLLIRLSDCRRPCTVSEIASCCDVDLSVVSRHLATLRDAGLLRAQKRGKEVHYSVRCDALIRTLRDTADCLERCCGNAAQPSPTSQGAR